MLPDTAYGAYAVVEHGPVDVMPAARDRHYRFVAFKV